jgi:(1->4)-alpha-D-glucan 1-alpha-D-glucosylmutase
MAGPVATYRIQFREHIDFAGAAALAPYLAGLGVSHLYGSPVFAAAPDSTHGYDIARYDRIEESLGGSEGFDRMAAALREKSLSILLDIVPNHMGATPHNPWWRDVLEWGPDGQYARHFDIDWSAGKLIVPVLGAPYGTALTRGDMKLKFDPSDGGLSIDHYGMRLPLNPPSYARVLLLAENDRLTMFANKFAVATPETEDDLKAELRDAAREPEIRAALEGAVAAMEGDPDRLHELHESQAWRLAYWRAARERLTYRRFFEVADLVGVRVEQPSVFDSAHLLVLALVIGGQVDGLRIDHVDGLADPKAYLDRLRGVLGPDDETWIVVEKILGPGEHLRTDWPIAGTTGYEFIRAVGALLADPAGEAPLTEAYHAFIGEEFDYRAMLERAKRRILSRNLAGELDVLTNLALDLARNDLGTRDFGGDTLRRAIIEIATALPVYRTYVDVEGPREDDVALIEQTIADAAATREIENIEALDFIARIWRLDLPDPEARAHALAFVTRLQQTTGPIMAKALEDTLFYRYNRLIALNEVGGEPDHFAAPPEAFHKEMQERARRQPLGLLASSTHDTKRGEDARARIMTISELPGAWAEAAGRWRGMNAGLTAQVDDSPAPHPNDEWMFYQALLGVWPMDLAPDDADGLARLADRMSAYMQKALREAKDMSTWTAPNEDYEQATDAFVRAALDPSRSGDFLRDFHAAAAPFWLGGALNSYTQTLLKMTCPGVPDIYQGSELWDFSLVDPDNRCAIDFDARRKLLEEEPGRDMEGLLETWRDGALKFRIVRAGLGARRAAPELFKSGAYLPLTVEGPESGRVIAFMREEPGGAAALIVAPCRAGGLLDAARTPFVPPQLWGDTRVQLPDLYREAHLDDVLTGRSVQLRGGTLAVAELLARSPVSLSLPRR